MNDINILQKISCLNGCLKGLVEINGDFGEYGAGADIVSFSCGANIFDIVKRRVNSEKYQANIVGDLIKYVSEYIYSMLFVRPFGVDFEVLSSNQKHDLANYAGHESIDIILDILGSNYDDEILEIKFFEEFGDLTVFCLKSYTLDGFLVIYFSKGKVKYKSIINYSRLNQLAGYCLGVSRAGNYALKRSLDVNILSKNNNTSCYQLLSEFYSSRGVDYNFSDITNLKYSRDFFINKIARFIFNETFWIERIPNRLLRERIDNISSIIVDRLYDFFGGYCEEIYQTYVDVNYNGFNWGGEGYIFTLNDNYIYLRFTQRS